MLKYAVLVSALFLCFFTSILDAQQLKRSDPKSPGQRIPGFNADSTFNSYMREKAKPHVWPDRMPTVTGDTTIDPHMPMYPHGKGTKDDILQSISPEDFVPVDKQPVPTYRVNPVYPDSARRTGLEGTVWLKALVDTDGMVKKAVVEKSDNRIFNDAAIQALLQWKFVPAMLDGKSVRVWAMVPFHFKLGPKK